VNKSKASGVDEAIEKGRSRLGVSGVAKGSKIFVF
jgi:hypothetical protein